MGNTKHTKEQIRERIQQKKLLFDGAFGTYYGGKYDTKQLPELANLEAPERVREIHTEYLEAGAQILRTNTFAANSFCMDRSKEQIEETLRSGIRLAREAVAAWRARTGETKEVYIAGDIGQIPCDVLAQKDTLCREYEEICRIFLEEGVDFFVFETFSEMEELLPAIKMIGEQAFITVQFSVNQFGYSNAGLSARKLLQREVRQRRSMPWALTAVWVRPICTGSCRYWKNRKENFSQPFPMLGILRWSPAVCSSPGITKTILWTECSR